MIRELTAIVESLTRRIRSLEAQEVAISADSLPKTLYAGLPVAGKPGRVRFVTNGRKSGEGAGAGTGVLAVDDGVAWRRVSDDTTVAA